MQPAPSRSQRKRAMKALGVLALRLSQLSSHHIEHLPDPALRVAVLTAKSLTRGNARRRQLQYIAKLLKTADLAPITAVLDRLDASSATHIKLFHQLEAWRQGLVGGEGSGLEKTLENTLEDTLEEICQRYPQTDRQHLRRLARNTIATKEAGRDPRALSRKVFRYLKEVATAQG